LQPTCQLRGAANARFSRSHALTGRRAADSAASGHHHRRSPPGSGL